MRVLLAAALIAAYLLCTMLILRAHRGRARVTADTGAADTAAADTGSPVLIAFASQTGYAEQIAWQTASALQAANVPMRVRSLAELTHEELHTAQRALFVVSTSGEGDPPDAGLRFVNTIMNDARNLPRLGYGVLALGDRTYRNFCGFGRTLDGWLKQQSAVPLFDLVEVDNADEAALRQWQQQLRTLTGSDDLPQWTTPESAPWVLARRHLVNPGSAGNPCYHLELTPPEGATLDWSAGDIAVLTLPDSSTREYSIASLPGDAALHILIRQSRRADGSLGAASGWLTERAPLGSTVPVRIRRNSSFGAPSQARPMLLIGNGTGIAGLRSHLKAREQAGAHRNWLVFGERNAQYDAFYREDIERWQRAGVLERTSLVFSRDQPERIYVQHALSQSAREVREWVADGAAIYVCGSAAGMSPAVEQALSAVLGRDLFEQLVAEGRFRRDVY